MPAAARRRTERGPSHFAGTATLLVGFAWRLPNRSPCHASRHIAHLIDRAYRLPASSFLVAVCATAKRSTSVRCAAPLNPHGTRRQLSSTCYIRQIAELAVAVCDAIEEQCTLLPYAFFGHSLGALLAYEVNQPAKRAAGFRCTRIASRCVALALQSRECCRDTPRCRSHGNFGGVRHRCQSY